MKGDFTRNTFDPAKHFSRVLMQQGRVTLDADFNEQAAILLHYVQTLAADLIGPYAAPSGNAGFQLTFDAKNNDLVIGAGRYYVDGILVENDEPIFYSQQEDLPLLDTDPLLAEIKNPTGAAFWAYLDVWERHITCIEDDEIREKALNGPDTCTRAKIVWQVKAIPAGQLPDPKIQPSGANVTTCAAPLGNLSAVSSGTMSARVDPGLKVQDACVTSPDAKYRGAENHLYRVEIHDSGDEHSATFKWSRDNGTPASAWLSSAANDLEVLNGRGFQATGWVELTDDTMDLAGVPGPLVKLANVQGNTLSVDPDTVPAPSAIAWGTQLIHPKIRRWDQTGNDDTQLLSGAVSVAAPDAAWIDLEDGVQVRFQPGSYRSGDYWLIPARVATGNVEWPPLMDDNGDPVTDAAGNIVPDALPPDGIEHHYAPLGFISLEGRNLTVGSCMCVFDPASSCFRGESLPQGAPLIRPMRFGARQLSGDAVEKAKAGQIVRRRATKRK